MISAATADGADGKPSDLGMLIDATPSILRGPGSSRPQADFFNL